MPTLSRLAVLVMTLAVLGCAPAYHSYQGCQIPCRYQAPCPLPATHYPDCVCRSCIAERLLQQAAPPARPAPATVEVAPVDPDEQDH